MKCRKCKKTFIVGINGGSYRHCKMCRGLLPEGKESFTFELFKI